MFKFVGTTLLGFCGSLYCVGDALACNGGCCTQAASCCSMGMSMSAPMPGMKDMPGMTHSQANAGTQYRSYSYQPSMMNSRTYSRSQARGMSDAGRKIRFDY